MARKSRTELLAFARYLRSLHPGEVRIAIVLDNHSPHLSTKVDTQVGDWTDANNSPTSRGPRLNWVKAQFTVL